MINDVVNKEMLYMGGNNWVLEWTLDSEQEDKYLRLSDTAFSTSTKSMAAIDNGEEYKTICYWEVGASSILDCADYNDLVESGYLEYFQMMCNEWAADPKQLMTLVAAPDPSLAEEIRTTYIGTDDCTIIWKEITRQIGDDDEPVSTEIIGWYYGEPDPEITKQYIGKLKAEYL